MPNPNVLLYVHIDLASSLIFLVISAQGIEMIYNLLSLDVELLLFEASEVYQIDWGLLTTSLWYRKICQRIKLNLKNGHNTP